MIKNTQSREDLILLVKNEKWDMVRGFFSYWENADELIDKVLLFGHTFLPHYFVDKSPEFHRDLIKTFFTLRNEYTAAPRGFSKTTIMQLCMMFSAVNKLDTFLVLVEKTFTEASEVLNGVRAEFVDNRKILKTYGNLIQTNRELKEGDEKGDFFINGVRFRAIGFEKTVRGLKSREHRPSRIICDDIETDEHINSPDQRLKYFNNYKKGVIPAVDVNGYVKIYGTILHFDSLLKNLVEMHKGKIFRAYDTDDPQNTLLWPDRWSFERLEKKKAEMQSKGKSSNAFAQEYLNDPVSEEDRKFKYEWLWRKDRNVTLEDLKFKMLNGYATIDVADSMTPGADFTGCIVHLVDSAGNRFRVDVRREKRNSLGLIDLIFEIWEKWRPFGLLKIGIEKKALNDQVKPLFELEKKKRVNVFPIIEELKPMGRNKNNRIEGALQGLYETGKIYTVGELVDGEFIPVGDTEILKNELYNFPSSAHDDLSDAEAYISDIAEVPAEMRKEPPAHVPQDDPFENEAGNSVNLDPFEELKK